MKKFLVLMMILFLAGISVADITYTVDTTLTGTITRSDWVGVDSCRLTYDGADVTQPFLIVNEEVGGVHVPNPTAKATIELINNADVDITIANRIGSQGATQVADMLIESGSVLNNGNHYGQQWWDSNTTTPRKGTATETSKTVVNGSAKIINYNTASNFTIGDAGRVYLDDDAQILCGLTASGNNNNFYGNSYTAGLLFAQSGISARIKTHILSLTGGGKYAVSDVDEIRTWNTGSQTWDYDLSKGLNPGYVTIYIPEPMTIVLLGLGGLMLRRKK